MMPRNAYLGKLSQIQIVFMKAACTFDCLMVRPVRMKLSVCYALSVSSHDKKQ